MSVNLDNANVHNFKMFLFFHFMNVNHCNYYIVLQSYRGYLMGSKCFNVAVRVTLG